MFASSATLVGDSEPVEVPEAWRHKAKNSPLWKGDPDQQLTYYTEVGIGRGYKPEMLLGVYDVDEVEGFAPMRDVTPREEALPTVQSRRGCRRNLPRRPRKPGQRPKS